MRLSASLSIAALMLGSPAVVRAQAGSPPVMVAEWSTEKVSAMGREIYTQDAAAWVATDRLLEALDDAEEATIRGWVVLGEGPNRTVRFLKAAGDDVAPGWDLAVVDGVASAPVSVADQTLSGESLARYQARQTAADNIGALRCGRYNSVVARDPESEGWIVWLLASTTQAGVMPMGGHYRFHVSADGLSMISRDQLSTGCLNLPAQPPAGAQGQSLGAVVSPVVSKGPVETHVFLSLSFKTPVYVAAGETLFAVDGDHIREVRQGR